MGAGKSTAAELLGKLLEYDVLDADILCRNLMEPYMPGWQGVQKKWGARFFDLSGKIDRPALRKALFADPVVRQNVERILHPLVLLDLRRHGAEHLNLFIDRVAPRVHVPHDVVIPLRRQQRVKHPPRQHPPRVSRIARCRLERIIQCQ